MLQIPAGGKMMHMFHRVSGFVFVTVKKRFPRNELGELVFHVVTLRNHCVEKKKIRKETNMVKSQLCQAWPTSLVSMTLLHFRAV